MKITLDCLPCTLNMALRNARMVTEDQEAQKAIVQKTVEALRSVSWNSLPIELAMIVNRIIIEVTGDPDPFKKIRKKSNDIAMRSYEELRKILEKSDDDLKTALKLSAAGNSIDFGAYIQPDLKESVQRALKTGFAVDDYEIFREKAMRAEKMIFFLDNAGEIVFDKLLIETILRRRGRPFKVITLVVKGGPLMNDVLVDDVEYVNLKELPNVEVKQVSNGEKETGPWISSKEVQDWIEDHDLVIFKGQANFEAFEDRRDAFFILIVKCPIVAKKVGAPMGSLVLKYSGRPS